MRSEKYSQLLSNRVRGSGILGSSRRAGAGGNIKVVQRVGTR
jgi:hypothetical protein